jgi:glycosyltransferase involved in cell wall biosynthesis
MANSAPFDSNPHMVWVYPENPAAKLDSATWLDMTDELRTLGWEVTLIACGQSGRGKSGDIEVTYLGKPRIYLFGQVVFHLRVLYYLALHWGKIDLIYFHPMSAPWLLPLRILRGQRRGAQRPLIVMDSRTIPMETPGRGRWRDVLRGRFLIAMNGFANRWADGQTAITRRLAEFVDIPEKMLWGTWSSGVNRERFSTAELIRKWPVGQESIHLIYTGILSGERNLFPLAVAVGAALQENIHFNLTLIGSGDQQDKLKLLARETQGRIRILPPVPHVQIPALLARAHIGVLPFPDEPKFQVSSPIKLFEYLASGMPVFATRISSHTDLFSGKEYIFWSESADANGLLIGLREIWDCRGELALMGSMAAIASSQWTWEKSASSLSRALQVGLQGAETAPARYREEI